MLSPNTNIPDFNNSVKKFQKNGRLVSLYNKERNKSAKLCGLGTLALINEEKKKGYITTHRCHAWHCPVCGPRQRKNWQEVISKGVSSFRQIFTLVVSKEDYESSVRKLNRLGARYYALLHEGEKNFLIITDQRLGPASRLVNKPELTLLLNIYLRQTRPLLKGARKIRASKYLPVVHRRKGEAGFKRFFIPQELEAVKSQIEFLKEDFTDVKKIEMIDSLGNAEQGYVFTLTPSIVDWFKQIEKTRYDRQKLRRCA